jgi:hypothetical protein
MHTASAPVAASSQAIHVDCLIREIRSAMPAEAYMCALAAGQTMVFDDAVAAAFRFLSGLTTRETTPLRVLREASG